MALIVAASSSISIRPVRLRQPTLMPLSSRVRGSRNRADDESTAQRGTVVALDTVQRRLRLLDRLGQRVATAGMRGRQALDLVHRAGL